jgi:Fe-S oxidoreductase
LNVLRLVLGLGMTVVALAVAGRRVHYLYRLVSSGQTAPGRLDGIGQRAKDQLREVFGQRKLLTWSVPGVAHFFTFWAFIVLAATILEAYGALFDRDFAIPVIGRWALLGFLEDFFAVAVLLSLATFAVIRLRNAPARKDRASRFYGSHTRAAWVVLFMIFNVIWTLLLLRGAHINPGVFPFPAEGWWAFASTATAEVLEPLGESTNEVLETAGILAQIGVVLGFLVIVVYSKHLHIFVAPLNVLTKREPDGLGPLLPMMAEGKPIDFENIDELDEDTAFGRGKIEDFTWKGMLDFATCTECGRCQSQCPAWNTGKPLSPKLVIMDLRDHLFAQGSEAGEGDGDARPLVGTAEQGGVIDPDVLWSCTTCGACVEQCPVDIEHVDHIVDMRRFQVLVESSFPSEAGTMLKNLENKGNPWGMGAKARLEWTQGLPFDVPVLGQDVEDLSSVDYLYWVGCAGALEDRAKKTTRAFAELLHMAGVSFAVLGEAEACTGDPARRLGNEFVFAPHSGRTGRLRRGCTPTPGRASAQPGRPPPGARGLRSRRRERRGCRPR